MTCTICGSDEHITHMCYVVPDFGDTTRVAKGQLAESSSVTLEEALIFADKSTGFGRRRIDSVIRTLAAEVRRLQKLAGVDIPEQAG